VVPVIEEGRQGDLLSGGTQGDRRVVPWPVGRGGGHPWCPRA